MSDRINLQKKASDLHKSPQFDSYSKVVIHIDDETDITVGDDYGRTLEITNPFGTRQIAEDLLEKLRGFQYQPYTATGTLLDPSAEIGDAVTIKKLYGGIYTRDRTFSRLMKTDISAPQDEEINHEYKFATPQERKVKRELGNVRASIAVQADRITAEVAERTAQGQAFESQLAIQATQIAAKVSSVDGNTNTFGWVLNSIGHTWYSNGQAVMKVSDSGLEVNGKITATSGFIGNGANGFTISGTAIYNNISQFGGTQTTGIYIGTNGIQLGQNFRVDSTGNLTAASGTFTGNIYAKNIQYGGSYGTLNGSAISDYSLDTGQFAQGVRNSLGFADFSNRVFNERASVKYMDAQFLYNSIACQLQQVIIRDSLQLSNNSGEGFVNWHSVTVNTPSGTKTIRYLGSS